MVQWSKGGRKHYVRLPEEMNKPLVTSYNDISWCFGGGKMFYILAITVLVYLGVIIFTRKRIAITLIGSGVLLMVGAVTNLFDVSEAFRGFPSG